MVTLGRHSYCTGPLAYFEPEVFAGHFTAIASPCTFLGKSQHPLVEFPDLAANYPFNNVPYGMSHNIDYPKTGGNPRIIIGNDVWIGYDCLIMGGVTIGDGAIIGARTVVSKDIPPYAVVVGSPPIIKRYRFDPKTIEALLRIRWWDWDDEVIMERVNDFKDIKSFIKKYAI